MGGGRGLTFTRDLDGILALDPDALEQPPVADHGRGRVGRVDVQAAAELGPVLDAGELGRGRDREREWEGEREGE